MARKKTPLEPKGRRMRAYELPGMETLRVPQDPIREVEDQALRDLSNEYRVLRIEEMILKKKKQLGLSEPTSNVQLQKQNLELIKAAMDLAKSTQPPPGSDKSFEYVKLISEIYGNIMKNQGRSSSFFENMLMDPTLYSRAQDIGIFSNKSGTQEINQFSVEIEKLRGERDMSNRRFDLEIQKSRLQAEQNQMKINAALQFLSPFASMAGNTLAQGVYEKGRQVAGAPPGFSGNPGHNPTSQGHGGEFAEVQLDCECGFRKPMLLRDPPPSRLPCPGCGRILDISPGPSPVSDSETASVWKSAPETRDFR